MTDYSDTPYAQEARTRKAIRLEAVLRMTGCDVDTARALDPQGRRDAERAAGVRKSSGATWEVVFTLLDDAWRDSPPPPAPPPPLLSRHVTPRCPVDGLGQGDPGVCHHCGAVITGGHVDDGRAPTIRFCSQVCSRTHLVGAVSDPTGKLFQ